MSRLEDEEFTLPEVAYLCGLSMQEAIEEVCDCDDTYGYVCEYHKDNQVKHTLKEWQDLSTLGDENGMYHYTRFLPINEIGETLPMTKKKTKNQ